MTYQTVTGTLNPGAHPGSYNGQDVYSDLLITEERNERTLHRQRADQPDRWRNGRRSELYARPTGDCAVQHDLLLWGGETSQTLDGSYYKGPGARNGKEREILSMEPTTDLTYQSDAEPTYMSDRKGHNGITEDGTATTLTAQEKERPIVGCEDDQDYWGDPSEPEPREMRVGSSIVRRLTPHECLLLQGYPKDWCDIGDYTDEKGKLRHEADTAKYKAAGNSIALPFWAWLWRRIAAQYERPATMGSLFDGIGGFPLTAMRSGIKPLWASEIEAFPIAVVKKHFGDEDAGTKGDIWKYL